MCDRLKDVMQELSEFNFNLSILHKIIGVDFWRCFEYSLAYQKTNPREGMNVLDIGATSISFFPLFVASKGVKITVIDIDNKSVYHFKKFAKKVDKRKNLETLVCDAQKMGFSDNAFDVVYAISTIEHIPFDGDIRTVREINRVLKIGGKAIITVPYGLYKEGSWGRWFQRTYDYKSIENRIIKPSKLQLENLIFCGDAKVQKFAKIIYGLPRTIRFAFGWSHIFFAKHFSDKDKADKNSASLAIVVLRKRLSK